MIIAGKFNKVEFKKSTQKAVSCIPIVFMNELLHAGCQPWHDMKKVSVKATDISTTVGAFGRSAMKIHRNI